ncbi:MAG: BamA/TamA family outer membrane protein [Pseudomonadota bacterium]
MSILRPAIACAVGLLASLTPAHAQTPLQEQADPTGQGQRPEAEAEPPRTVVPRSPELGDLIPADVVDNPEVWATPQTGSASEKGAAAPDLEDSSDAVLDLEAALIAPTPLDVDPESSLADAQDLPELAELPQVREARVGKSLTLAFPSDPALFPESSAFLARFKALSTIEQLESGKETVSQLIARAGSDEQLLADMLRTYGYYDGEVIRQLSGGRRDRNLASDNAESRSRARDNALNPQVRFDIIPGIQYTVGSVDFGALDTLEPSEVSDLASAFEVTPGDPLYSDRIAQEAGDLRLALADRGYPFAVVDEPSILVDHSRREGDITVPTQPGGVYEFGAIVSDDPEFLSNAHLSKVARFEPGDIYQASLQSDLRRAVLATGLVSSVAVIPRETRAPSADQPGEVALDVALDRAPLRTISGGIGYGTEEGVRLEAGWEHRNLFPPEGALLVRAIAGTQEQLASVGFRRSNFRARDQILTIDAYFSDLDTDAIDARTIALRGTFERVSNLLFQKQFSWALGAEILRSEERNSTFFDTPVPRQTYVIGGLFGRALLDGSDDLLDPTRGFRAALEIAPDVSRTQGETSVYTRLGGDLIHYQPVGRHVLAGRAHLETIVGAGLTDIAPSRRLYAGGGGSVRGYAFQAIGPRDEFGNPTGGRSLAEFSLEARIRTGLLDGSIDLVPFVDAGSVSTSPTPDFGVIRLGAGLGVRYRTSFGPIRVDVGVPLNPDQFDSAVAVYISIGQAF